MPSIGSLIASRVLPLLLVITSTYLVPWIQRKYLISGLSGKNFQQSEISHCNVIYPDKLTGCEDIHVYNAPTGPQIFAGCAEKIDDRYVSPPMTRIMVDVVSRHHSQK
jgi:hypothetical protein